MPRTSAKERRAQYELIAKRLSTGFTDTDIMTQLGIKRATFYHYKKQVYQIWGDLAGKKTEDSIAFEADLFKDRLIRLLRGLELRLNDSKNDTIKDVADASAIAAQIATAIFKLEYEGLRATRMLKGAILNEQKGLSRVTDLGNVQSQLPERDVYSGGPADSESDVLDVETIDTEQQPDTTQEKVF